MRRFALDYLVSKPTIPSVRTTENNRKRCSPLSISFFRLPLCVQGARVEWGCAVATGLCRQIAARFQAVLEEGWS